MRFGPLPNSLSQCAQKRLHGNGRIGGMNHNPKILLFRKVQDFIKRLDIANIGYLRIKIDLYAGNSFPVLPHHFLYGIKIRFVTAKLRRDKYDVLQQKGIKELLLSANAAPIGGRRYTERNTAQFGVYAKLFIEPPHMKVASTSPAETVFPQAS